MSESVHEALVTGKEIEELAEKVLPALIGATGQLAVATLLSLCIKIMQPDVTEEQLIEGVHGSSAWIVMFLSGAGDTPETVN